MPITSVLDIYHNEVLFKYDELRLKKNPFEVDEAPGQNNIINTLALI